MTGESHIENLKAGGGAGFQNPATSNLLMAGFDILNVQNITSPDAPSDGVDAGNFSVQAGSAVGTTTADGGRLGLYGGDAQYNGQAGNVIIRGGTADRVPGGAVLIDAGFSIAGTNNTGGIVRMSSAQGGTNGASGSANLTTPNGRGTANAGPVSLRTGSGGTGGGNGGLIELLAG